MFIECEYCGTWHKTDELKRMRCAQCGGRLVPPDPREHAIEILRMSPCYMTSTHMAAYHVSAHASGSFDI